MRGKYFCFALCGLMNLTHAQSDSTDADSVSGTATIYTLPEMQVFDMQTGLANRTPYNISEVSLNSLENRSNPSGIMGHIRDQPGVYGAEMGHGIVKPFIRGLGFSRVVTLYQGNKLENHQWGADHGLGLSDLGIGNVKIIKGPASILYGSGAIGGVLILEDDEQYLNTPQWSGSAGASYNSVSGGYRPYVSLGKKFANGFFVGTDIAVENHADYLDGDGRIIGNSRFNSETLRLHTGYQNKNFRGKLSYTYLNQNLGIIEDDEMEEGESLATTRYDRETQLPFQQVRDHIVAYNQVSQHGKWNVNLHLSHHINDRNEIEDAFDEIDLGLIQSHTFYNVRTRYQMRENLSHTFGLQGSYIHNRNKPEAEEILIPDAQIWENGLYYLGSLEWKKWLFEAGARYDYRKVNAEAGAQHIIDYGYFLPGNPAGRSLSQNFSGPTGSFGITRNIGEKHQFKTNFSTGFRAPDISELYSNGPHPGTNRFETGNTNFDREQSYQFDLTYQYSTKRWSGMVSPFVNRVDNYIFFAGTGEYRESDGLEYWRFFQTDAILYGTEFRLRYRPGKQFNIVASGSLVRGVFRNTGENLTFVPADNYQLRAEYMPWKKRKSMVFASLRYVDQQNRPGMGESNTPAFTLLNLGASHTIKLKQNTLNVGVSVFNALNTTYYDHMSMLRAFEITAPGRNLMVNVQYVF